jgi:hypothetical protein
MAPSSASAALPVLVNEQSAMVISLRLLLNVLAPTTFARMLLIVLDWNRIIPSFLTAGARCRARPQSKHRRAHKRGFFTDGAPVHGDIELIGRADRYSPIKIPAPRRLRLGPREKDSCHAAPRLYSIKMTCALYYFDQVLIILALEQRDQVSQIVGHAFLCSSALQFTSTKRSIILDVLKVQDI